MEWYGPLTVLPAIGLLILSTSNFIVSLNGEIMEMEMRENIKVEIVKLKLAQLKRLGIANACLYSAALSFMVAGLANGLFGLMKLSEYCMLFGVAGATTALIFLFIHSLKSVKIRQKNLKLE